MSPQPSSLLQLREMLQMPTHQHTGPIRRQADLLDRLPGLQDQQFGNALERERIFAECRELLLQHESAHGRIIPSEVAREDIPVMRAVLTLGRNQLCDFFS